LVVDVVDMVVVDVVAAASVSSWATLNYIKATIF
jgi:hypothetical protein